MASIIGVAIRTRLLNVTAVTSLVSTRIYPQVLPQGCTLPAVRYSLVSSSRETLVGGVSGFADSTVQVDAYAETYLDAQNVAEQIKLALMDWAGTSSDIEIRNIQLRNQMDMYEAPIDADDVGAHRVALDFEIIHQEPVPSH